MHWNLVLNRLAELIEYSNHTGQRQNVSFEVKFDSDLFEQIKNTLPTKSVE